MDAIKFFGDLQRLDLKHGDKFVLTVDRPISDAAAANIKRMWHAFAGEDVPLLILEGGMKIGVIGKAGD